MGLQRAATDSTSNRHWLLEGLYRTVDHTSTADAFENRQDQERFGCGGDPTAPRSEGCPSDSSGDIVESDDMPCILPLAMHQQQEPMPGLCRTSTADAFEKGPEWEWCSGGNDPNDFPGRSEGPAGDVSGDGGEDMPCILPPAVQQQQQQREPMVQGQLMLTQ